MNSDSTVSGLLFICSVQANWWGEAKQNAPEHVSCVIRRELSDAVGTGIAVMISKPTYLTGMGGTHTQLL